MVNEKTFGDLKIGDTINRMDIITKEWTDDCKIIDIINDDGVLTISMKSLKNNYWEIIVMSYWKNINDNNCSYFKPSIIK